MQSDSLFFHSSVLDQTMTDNEWILMIKHVRNSRSNPIWCRWMQLNHDFVVSRWQFNAKGNTEHKDQKNSAKQNHEIMSMETKAAYLNIE